MRTVTFSQPTVAGFMNANFVSTWKNIQPRPKFPPEKTQSPRIRKLVMERPGTGPTNICAYIATADGKILHVIQGYAGPELFLRELRFGMEAARELKARSDAKKLKPFYARRRRELSRGHGFDRLLDRNLNHLSSSPLPDLKDLSNNKRAGLLGRTGARR